ncbi:MAG: transcription elongation factor GreB [Bdellovibrionales bacterium]|mgnify:CR=1 FL=1|jgi:transcription elongation factor GreB|nr:transcription elongation factor GreB [Bdellovibrionales bacterium]
MNSRNLQPNYISCHGHKVLLDELEELQKVSRPKVVETISWAVSNGDRSENADYIYGKKKLREIDRRIRFLNTRLNTAQVVTFSNDNLEVIKFGATITLKSIDDQSLSYTILGIDEIELSTGKISWKSPIGRSLLGKGVGDEISIKTPNGTKHLEIIKFNYEYLK